MASFRKKGDVWYYRFIDGDGKPVERAGCPDRKATEQMARDAETAAAMQRAGLVDSKQTRYLRESKRSIGEHVSDFIQALEAKGSGADHVRTTGMYIRRVAELACWDRIGDMTPSSVSTALATLQADGRSARSLNGYLVACKTFSRWLRVDGRCPDYALESLGKRSEAVDVRRPRRALTQAEAARLIDAAFRGYRWGGLSGPDRAALYRTALGTGFRANELRSLTRESFNLDSDPPCVTLQAACSKNGRHAVQPVSEALAKALAPFLERIPPGRLVFAGMGRDTARMIRRDLDAAEVPFETDSGRVDFHSLRATYITYLVAAGVSPKEAQVLARHNDVSLTLRVYTKLNAFSLARAVERLPDLNTSISERESTTLEATGTADPIHRVNAVGSDLAHYLPIGETGSDRMATDGDGSVYWTCGESEDAKPFPEKGLDASHRMESDGVATCSESGKSSITLTRVQHSLSYFEEYCAPILVSSLLDEKEDKRLHGFLTTVLLVDVNCSTPIPPAGDTAS